MPDPFQQLLDDLQAEQQYLDAQLAELPDAVWERGTPCRGWLVRDVIAHLAEVDDNAAAIASGAVSQMEGGGRSADGLRSALQDRSRQVTRQQLVDWWRAARARLAWMMDEIKPLCINRTGGLDTESAASYHTTLRGEPPSVVT